MQAFGRRYPRYGYRRMTAVLQKEGWKVNKKRVQRLMRIVGIQVKQKAKKRRRLGLSTGIRRKAEYPNQVWSWDLIQDQTADGWMLKCLTILDEYTRESLRIRVDRYLTSGDVLMELQEVLKEYGVPEHIRSDNGPEFIAKAIQAWLKQKTIATLYISPGEPWENPYIESFHGKLRDGMLKSRIVYQPVGSPTDYRGLEKGVQSNSAPQFPGLFDSQGI